MQIKEVKPINFLYFKTDATVNELQNFLSVGQDVLREAVQQNLSITGPVHWHYVGFTGDESKPFSLEIAVPLAEPPQGYDGKFHVKRTGIFRCVSVIHEGNWLDIPKSYAKLMKFISANHLQPIAVNREIYVNVDFQNPEGNVTEIQIGIA